MVSAGGGPSLARTDRAQSRSGAAFAVLAALLAAVAPTARAQEAVVEEDAGDLGTLTEESRGVPVDGVHPVRLRFESRFIAKSDFGEADASFYRPRGQLRVTAPVSEDTAFRLVAEGSALFSDWDGFTDLFDLGPVRRDPFGTLIASELSLQGRHALGSSSWLAQSEQWALLGEGSLSSQLEEGADFDDSLAGGGSLALEYRIPDRLDLVAGAGVGSRLDKDDVRILPVVSAIWYATQRLRLRAHMHGARIDYELTEDVKLFARAQVRSRRYRLERRAGPTGKGTLRERMIPAGLGVVWKLDRRLRMSAFAGAVFDHEFRAYDSDRNRIDSIDSGAAPFFEIRLDLRP